MAVDHLLQQRKEACRRHRRSLPPGVQQAIQPGHVNAFDMRCRQVDLDIRPGVQLTLVGRFLDPYRQVDTLHADPLQRAEAGGQVGDGNVG
ncbi:hypothetical protein D3C75_989800 [compost metagenome]